MVASIKDYLLWQPAEYCGEVESLLEMIYFRFTEYNPVENERACNCFSDLETKIHNLHLQEENQYLDLIDNACGEYEW